MDRLDIGSGIKAYVTATRPLDIYATGATVICGVECDVRHITNTAGIITSGVPLNSSNFPSPFTPDGSIKDGIELITDEYLDWLDSRRKSHSRNEYLEFMTSKAPRNLFSRAKFLNPKKKPAMKDVEPLLENNQGIVFQPNVENHHHWRVCVDHGNEKKLMDIINKVGGDVTYGSNHNRRGGGGEFGLCTDLAKRSGGVDARHMGEPYGRVQAATPMEDGLGRAPGIHGLRRHGGLDMRKRIQTRGDNILESEGLGNTNVIVNNKSAAVFRQSVTNHIYHEEISRGLADGVVSNDPNVIHGKNAASNAILSENHSSIVGDIATIRSKPDGRGPDVQMRGHDKVKGNHSVDSIVGGHSTGPMNEIAISKRGDNEIEGDNSFNQIVDDHSSSKLGPIKIGKRGRNKIKSNKSANITAGDHNDASVGEITISKRGGNNIKGDHSFNQIVDDHSNSSISTVEIGRRGDNEIEGDHSFNQVVDDHSSSNLGPIQIGRRGGNEIKGNNSANFIVDNNSSLEIGKKRLRRGGNKIKGDHSFNQVIDDHSSSSMGAVTIGKHRLHQGDENEIESSYSANFVVDDSSTSSSLPKKYVRRDAEDEDSKSDNCVQGDDSIDRIMLNATLPTTRRKGTRRRDDGESAAEYSEGMLFNKDDIAMGDDIRHPIAEDNAARPLEDAAEQQSSDGAIPPSVEDCQEEHRKLNVIYGEHAINNSIVEKNSAQVMGDITISKREERTRSSDHHHMASTNAIANNAGPAKRYILPGLVDMDERVVGKRPPVDAVELPDGTMRGEVRAAILRLHDPIPQS